MLVKGVTYRICGIEAIEMKLRKPPVSLEAMVRLHYVLGLDLPCLWSYLLPADTWLINNVIITSKRRRFDVLMMFYLRHVLAGQMLTEEQW